MTDTSYSYDSKRHAWFYRDFSENGYFKTLRYDWALYAAVLNSGGEVKFYGHLKVNVLDWFYDEILPKHPEAVLIRRSERMEEFAPFSGAIDANGSRQYGLHFVRGRHHTVKIYDSLLAASEALVEQLKRTDKDTPTEVHLLEREVEVGEWEPVTGEALETLHRETLEWWGRFGLNRAQKEKSWV